jgi:rubrerythrin
MEDITVRAVLDYAIEKEIEAQTRYMQMAGVAQKESTKKLFLRLANMEESHKDKLRSLSARDVATYKLQSVPDLQVAEKMGVKEFKPDMNMLDAIALAIKAEEAALELYLEAAKGIPEGEDKKVFAVLAQEEKQHKLDLETEYRELQSDYDYNVKKEE